MSTSSLFVIPIVRRGVRVVVFAASIAVVVNLDALNFVAFHDSGQHGVGLDKELVVVGSLVGTFGDSLKIVEIELPLKAAKATHAKVVGHNVLDKLAGLVNGKGSSVGQKGGNLPASFSKLQVLEDAMQFLREGARTSLALALLWQWGATRKCRSRGGECWLLLLVVRTQEDGEAFERTRGLRLLLMAEECVWSTSQQGAVLTQGGCSNILECLKLSPLH